jgi:hypothetical protein
MMSGRNHIARILIIELVAAVPAVVHGQSVVGTSVPTKTLAAQCAPDLDNAVERIFANPGGKKWAEYRTVKQVPPLDGNSGERMIAVKTSTSGRHFVRFVDYGEDSATYQADCYDEGGALSTLQYDLRTAWGWGYEDVRTFDARGKVLHRSTRFFNTRNNQDIVRPAQADDVPDYFKPKFYKKFEAIPITGVLKKQTHATPQ